MKDPDSPQTTSIQLGTTGVTLDEVVAVARHATTVELSSAAREAMARSAALIEGFVAGNTPVYGVTTGFGSLATTVIPAERSAELQRALVRSHAAGMGDPVEPEVVRAMMLLRARTPGDGVSAVRGPSSPTCSWPCSTAGITPVVREHGSLGASGDLAPLRHCALALIGEGEVVGRERHPAADGDRARRGRHRAVTLRAKEGLALINGTDGILGMLVPRARRPRRAAARRRRRRPR